MGALYYTPFYSVKADTNDAIYKELSSLLDIAKLELTSLDIPALETEKSRLENQLIGIYLCRSP